MLRRLSEVLDGDVQRLYDGLSLPFRPRFFPIAKVLQSGAKTVGELAEITGVSQPAVTQTLNAMKTAGLVEIAGGLDRRTRDVTLSAEGRRIVGELSPLWAAIDRAAERLENELSGRLSALLDEALGALAARPFNARIAEELKSGGHQ